MMKQILSILFLIGTVQAFAPSSVGNSRNSNILASPPNNINRLPTTSHTSSTTALNARKWNFNQGRSPWGLKNNAEIWNGRLAQMAFTVVLLQEAITGKGAIASIQDGDAVGYAFLALAGVSTVGLTIWLAIKGDESDIIF